MSNKVDKLFKEKLEEHSLQPSAQAWEKVEAHLGKKNKMVVWVRLAAAVMLVGLLMFVGVRWSDQESGVRSQELGENRVPEKQQVDPVAVEKTKKVKQKKTRQPKVVAPVIEQVQKQEQQQVEEQIAVVPQPEVVPEIKNEIKNEAKKGITLIYSLPAIKKQEAPAEPLVAEEKQPKKTGIERVLEIAKEVKSGDALGELRQAKDDIFALDFRKDKNKKQ